MKKILLNLLFIFSMIVLTNNVYADSFGATLTGNETFTDEITIRLQISNYQDNDSTCQGICAFSADYSYDSSKIELLSVTSLNDFRLIQGNGNVVLSKATGVGSGSDLLLFTFKNKGLSNGESTTFTMSNLNASNGDDDITGNSVSKTIRYSAPPQSEPTPTPTPTPSPSSNKPNNANNNNTNNNSNTNSNTNNGSSSAKKDEKKSNNADLKNITISAGELTFSKDIFNYNVTVDNTTESITITVKTDDEKAKVTGDGLHKLVDGENKIELIVTAEDGTKKTYVINVSKDTELEPVITTSTDTQTIGTTPERKHINPFLIGIIIAAICFILIMIYIATKKKNKIQNNFNNPNNQYYN